MNSLKVFNRSRSQYILGIAFISLVTLVSSNLVTLNHSFFDEAVSIQYQGQVEGFPVQDAVTYDYTPTDENGGRVYFTMSRSEFNPYNLSESFAVSKTNGQVEIDLESVIHPMNLERDENTQMVGIGDKLDLPNSLVVGQELADKNGSLRFSVNGNVTKRIEIKVKNRKVVGKDEVVVDDQNYETFRLNYTVEVRKYYNGVLFETAEEDIQEWILSGVGFLKRISSTQGSYYNDGKVVNTYNTRFTLTAKSIQ